MKINNVAVLLMIGAMESLNTALAFTPRSFPTFAPHRNVQHHKSTSRSNERGNISPCISIASFSREGSTSLNVATIPTTLAEDTLNIVSVKDVEELNIDEDKSTSYLDDGFVFGLENSGIERPKGKVANVVVEDDSLETKPYQVALVSSTFLFHASLAIYSIVEILAANGGNLLSSGAQIIATIASCWVLADLGSGIFHWSVDNYGNGRTPILGNIIAAFQGHHSAPWTITQRGFCNNVHKLCIAFGIPTMLAISAVTGPKTTLFFALFCSLEILSQEFHKWSHMTKSEVPAIVNFLQDTGATIGRKPHALHHRAPYDGNYCIVTGFCNEFLDNSGFLRRMEHIVYKINGVESNSWKLDPRLREKTLSGDYSR